MNKTVAAVLTAAGALGAIALGTAGAALALPGSRPEANWVEVEVQPSTFSTVDASRGPAVLPPAPNGAPSSERLGSGTAAMAPSASASGQSALADEVGTREVTVLSALIDAIDSGQQRGGPLAYTTLVSLLASQLPPEIAGDPQVATVLVEANAAYLSFIAGNSEAIEQLRQAVDPAADANPMMNQAIESIAAALDTAADSLGPAIQPGDRSMHKLATMLRDYERGND